MRLCASLAVLLAGLTLTACTATGGGGLSPGLSARMDVAGAQLDRGAALQIVNHYRSTVGSRALVFDTGLSGTAQQLASQYANSDAAPRLPQGVAVLRTSAGYANFADTFSGWRSNPADAAALATAGAERAGLGVAYSASSTHGVYWVLLLDE
jgi:uncharacterized protein YkwD